MEQTNKQKIEAHIESLNERIGDLEKVLDEFDQILNTLKFSLASGERSEDVCLMLEDIQTVVEHKYFLVEDELSYLCIKRDDLQADVNIAIEKALDDLKWTPCNIAAIVDV